MNKLKNLHDVSALYFFALAFTYIVLALAFRNGAYTDWAMVGMKILDIPFAAVALLYGSSTLYLQLTDSDEEETSPWIMVVVAFSLLLFGLVVFVNFAFPSII